MKVLLGLSGGVDSAVAAYLLKKQGHDVTGCFMRNWDALANGDYLGNPTINNSQCPQEKDWDDACLVAKKLGIEILRVDYIKEYWDNVFSYLIKEYEAGRTPNPDIFCNKYIKFGPFIDFAKAHGFEAIAMGHYAKKIDKDGKAYLLKSFDKNKDQTYFLSQISQEQVSFCLFPLGDIVKEDVRKIAHELDLTSVMDKKDSTGVCFIGERNFKEFLKNYIPAQKGKIVDISNGRVLGEHDGVMYYTIGQRKGLGIGGIHGEEAKGWFIAKKDIKDNILYVASGDESEYLLSDRCTVDSLNWITDIPKEGEKIQVKFRYRQQDNIAYIHFMNENTIELIYEEPIKAVTPGQAAVIYQGEICLGGGLIDKTFYKGKRNDL